MLSLKIITPEDIVYEGKVLSVSAPSPEGEITVLPRHTNLFSLLGDGVVTIRMEGKKEEHLAIGAGYLETDGTVLNILVSRAHGQDTIDEALTTEAIARAKQAVVKAKTPEERMAATAILHRHNADLKLLKKRRHRPAS